MHIPDGYLTPVTYGGLWGAMVPVWFLASKRLQGMFLAARVPYLAMASAFSLLVMILVIPLPGGTTGHLCGAALIAILLGPSVGIMAVSVSLIIQAAVFGDGGITALGANCFNIAFVGSLSGYGAYRLFSFVGKKWRRGDIVSAGLAAYLSINLSAFLAAVELGVQPLITTGYFPYGLKVTLPAVMSVHLMGIGVFEGIMTGLVVSVVRRWPAFQHAEV